jgi:hypothetical protein
VNRDDAQAVHDFTYFLRQLLALADHLPPDLTAMLRDYEQGLEHSPPARWNGAGDPAQANAIARHIAQSLTDNETPVRDNLADPARNRHAFAQNPATFRRALQLLAVQGEITTSNGTYQPRPAP